MYVFIHVDRVSFSGIAQKTAELKIIVCHRSFSDPLWNMTEQVQFGRTYSILLYISNGEAIDSLKLSAYLNE